MKKYLPSIVCGFGAGVLLVTPIIKVFTCCLVIPIAGLLSVVLDQKANPTGEKISIQKGIVLGLMTGILAGLFGTFFEVLITYITHSNEVTENFHEMKELWKNFPQQEMLKPAMEMFDIMISDIEEYGFSLPYAIFLLVNNLFTGILFGILGGLLGMKISNTGFEKNNNSN